jgi:histone H3/H4
MKKSEITKLTNAQLLKTYTAQCLDNRPSAKAVKEQKWVLEEIAKRLGDVTSDDVDYIIQM